MEGNFKKSCAPMVPENKDSPKSTDLDGWRQAIADKQLGAFRLEAIAAAFEDLGPRDKRVQEGLAKHLSDAILKILRPHVGFHHANRGEDIILRVHGKIFTALLRPPSADGRGLRVAFVPRVLFRLKDAIAEEERERRVPDETRRRGKRGSGKARDDTGEAEEASEVGHLTEIQSSAADTEDSEEAEFAPVKMRDTSLLDGVRDTDQEIDVTRILERVCDPRKRLAFHLFMDGVPYKSKHSDVYTVAQALGVSEKTARNWVEEVRQVLRDDERVRFLKQRKEGGGS
jgi:hypothetical protein